MRTLIGVADSITVRERRLLRLRHTFSGASLTPSDQGPAFSTAENVPTVSGGVMAIGASQPLGVFAAGLAANVIAQMRVNFGNSTGTDRRASLQIRASAYNGNVIEAVLHKTADNVQIWRRDAGPATTLAISAALSLQNSTDYWLRVRAVGNVIEVFTSTDERIWTSRVTATESLYATNTGLAVRLADNGTPRTITVDDLLVWRAP